MEKRDLPRHNESEDDDSGDLLIAQNINSCFQVAKSLVSKITEINAAKRLILIADDEPLTFYFLRELFEDARLSVEVQEAASGRQAYEMALTSLPDMIITDWLMPEINGVELISKLRKLKATKDIPCILMSAASLPFGELRKVIQLGVTDYISKPFKEEEVIASVKATLARNRIIENAKANTELWPVYVNEHRLSNHLSNQRLVS